MIINNKLINDILFEIEPFEVFMEFAIFNFVKLFHKIRNMPVLTQGIIPSSPADPIS